MPEPSRPVIVRARPPRPRPPGTRAAPPPRLRLAPAAALRVFRDLIAEAGIDRDAARRLLGLPATARALPAPDALTEEQLRRIHALLDITTSLRLARDQAVARTWLTTPDRGALRGLSPLQHMIRHGLPGFADVQRAADALANE